MKKVLLALMVMVLIITSGCDMRTGRAKASLYFEGQELVLAKAI